jgi:flagellar hook-associated protein 2
MADISFQGITTGIKTDALVTATLAQEGRGVAALQARQAKNALKTTALTTMKYSLSSFSVTIAVLQDKVSSGSLSTDAMQDVVNKFNTIYKAYKESSATTRTSDRAAITQIRQALTGVIGTGTYQNLSSIGVKTLSDGTLSLNTAAYQTALATDPTSVKSIISFTQLKSALSDITASSENSSLVKALQGIETQNKNLSVQINAGLAALERRKKILTTQFSKMETLIAQMKAAAGSLGTIA